MGAFSYSGGFMGQGMNFLVLLVIGSFWIYLVSELARLRRRLAALSRIEAKLDLVLQHAGLKYVPYANLPAPVIAALQSGRKIQAIKLYRDATGAGLKEAKELIEEVMATSTSQETIQVGPRK
jgi:ribosomal protein L7/L12